MKNYASDIDVKGNLIRVHSPSHLTQQDSYKSARAAAVKNKVELEDQWSQLYQKFLDFII